MQLIYSKKTFTCTVLSTFSIGFNIALNIIFIMKWGAIGAAWGTFLAAAISGLIYFVIAQKYYLIKWEYAKIGTIFLIFFVSAMLMIILRNFDINYEIRLICKGISIGLYTCLGIKFNLITMDNYRLLRDTVFLRMFSCERRIVKS